MSDVKPRVRLFTEIDAVLDTRFSLLKKYYPEVIASTDLTAYLSRVIDEFDGVPYDVFKKRYDARGDDALEFAVMSNIHSIIATTLHGAYIDSINLPLTDKPLIILNLWPYTFNEKERAVLLESFQLNYGSFATVALANIPLANITPDYLKENVDLLILYNTSEWLGLQNKAFETKRIPGKKLISPALYQIRVPTESELNSASSSLSLFDIIHKTLSPLIDLSFIDVEAFSIYSSDFSDRIYAGAQVSRSVKGKVVSDESVDDELEKAFRPPAA